MIHRLRVRQSMDLSLFFCSLPLSSLSLSLSISLYLSLSLTLSISLPLSLYITEVSFLVRGTLRVHAICFYLPLLSLAGNTLVVLVFLGRPRHIHDVYICLYLKCRLHISLRFKRPSIVIFLDKIHSEHYHVLPLSSFSCAPSQSSILSS